MKHFDTRLRRLEAQTPEHSWRHTAGLASLLAYARQHPPEGEEPLDLESTPMGRLLAEARRVVEEGRPGAEPRDLACDLPVVAAGASGRHPRVACAGAQ